MTIQLQDMLSQAKYAGKRALFSSVVLCAAALAAGQSCLAQNQDVQVVNLKVVRNASGGQSVITPKGDLAPLPGAGVNGDVAQIYFGTQGGFWYQDQTGKTVDLSAAVRELQARRTQQVPQYAPVYNQAPATTQVQNYNQTQSSSSGSGVGTAVTTAAAAAGGAALGAAMTHGFYNAPYGTPMYYNNGNAYYDRDGERKQLDDLNSNQKAVLYNKRTKENQQKEQQQQALMQQRQSNQQSGQSQANFNSQQQYYHDQVKQNPGQFQGQSGNPFAANSDDRSDRGSRGDRSDRGSRGDRSDRAARGDRGDRSERGARADRSGGSFAGRGGGGRAGGGGGRRGR